MFRKFKFTNKATIAGVALALAGVASFARSNSTFSKVLRSAPFLASSQRSAEPKPDNQTASSTRPLVKILLSSTILRDGEHVPVEKAGVVRPGEVINVTVDSVNDGTASAHDYRAIGQIPKGTRFIEGTPQTGASASITYSIDGGDSFSAQPMVEEKQADGTMKKIPAPVELYTQVRFEWIGPLVAGGKVSASYQIRVK